VVAVVEAGADFDEGFGVFDLGAVGGATDELGVGGGLAHSEEAAGVIDIGVGGHDVLEIFGVEADGLEVGEDVFVGGGGVAGVHEHGEVLAEEEVELEWAAVVVDGDLMNVGENLWHGEDSLGGI
jgi:hypothetical protein